MASPVSTVPVDDATTGNGTGADATSPTSGTGMVVHTVESLAAVMERLYSELTALKEAVL